MLWNWIGIIFHCCCQEEVSPRKIVSPISQTMEAYDGSWLLVQAFCHLYIFEETDIRIRWWPLFLDRIFGRSVILFIEAVHRSCGIKVTHPASILFFSLYLVAFKSKEVKFSSASYLFHGAWTIKLPGLGSPVLTADGNHHKGWKIITVWELPQMECHKTFRGMLIKISMLSTLEGILLPTRVVTISSEANEKVSDMWIWSWPS